MRKAIFRIFGRFNGAQSATVTIDRQSLTMEVRPLRRRKTYVASLSDLAQTVILRQALAEAREKKKDRRVRRRNLLLT